MNACDTGFFVEYLNANGAAAEVWEAARARKQKLIVSVVSLYELRRLALKGVIEPQRTKTLLTLLPSLCQVVYLGEESSELLKHAARLAHGNALSMADSLILASALSLGASKLYTTDSDMAKYQGKDGPSIELL